VTIPTPVMAGGKSPTWFHQGTQALAGTLHNAAHRVIGGQRDGKVARTVGDAVLQQLADIGANQKGAADAHQDRR
jgi:hypothetical protein